jgi:putative copper export protein
VRETRWGHGWSVGAAGVLAIIIGLLAARRALGGWMIAALGAVLVALGQALTGHAASNSHVALAVSTDVVHVLGAGGWLGGLVVIVLSAFPATRRLSGAESIKAGSALVRSYHNAAVECVALVVISAAVATTLRLSAVSDLWTTPYGNMLLRKLFFVVVVLVFGLYHWRRVVNVEWADDTRARFRRSAILWREPWSSRSPRSSSPPRCPHDRNCLSTDPRLADLARRRTCRARAHRSVPDANSTSRTSPTHAARRVWNPTLREA